MTIDFSFDLIPDDPTKIQDGSGNRPDPGKGMVIINKFDEYGAVNGTAHLLELEIVAWDKPGNETKIQKEHIFANDKSGKGFPMKRLTCLAMAAGLFNANDVKRWKAEGAQPQMDMTKLVGRPIMVQLVEEPDSKDATKTYINIGNIGLAMYHIKDPRVKGWPVNQTIFNARAALVGEWIAEPKAGETKAAQAAAAKTGPTDPFAALAGNV